MEFYERKMIEIQHVFAIEIHNVINNNLFINKIFSKCLYSEANNETLNYFRTFILMPNF